MKLDEIYARIPRMECQGLCVNSCGIIPVFPVEAAAIAAAGHPPLGQKADGDGLTCSALRSGRCSIYEQRPAICRMWGVVDSPQMTCPYGCSPERRDRLKNSMSKRIFGWLMALSGGRAASIPSIGPVPMGKVR